MIPSHRPGNKASVYSTYYLVSGHVVFLPYDPETPEGQQTGASTATLNTLGKLPPDKKIDAAYIGRLQQSLQANLSQKLGMVPFKFLDVVINHIMKLGDFKEGEFEKGSVLEDKLPSVNGNRSAETND